MWLLASPTAAVDIDRLLVDRLGWLCGHRQEPSPAAHNVSTTSIHPHSNEIKRARQLKKGGVSAPFDSASRTSRVVPRRAVATRGRSSATAPRSKRRQLGAPMGRSHLPRARPPSSDPADTATCHDSYDTRRFPRGSGCKFTRFFIPNAVRSVYGDRLRHAGDRKLESRWSACTVRARSTRHPVGYRLHTMDKEAAHIPDTPAPDSPPSPRPSLDSPTGTTARERPTPEGDGLDPTRYGDWEKNGRCIDF